MPAGAPRAETIVPRVLVVDDYQDGADSLALMLRALGADARAAYDGESAVQSAADFRPHLVLLDLGLPGATGVDIGRAILDMIGGASPAPRVVAVSGRSDDASRQACADAGFTGFLVKPVGLEAIARVVDECRPEAPEPPDTHSRLRPA